MKKLSFNLMLLLITIALVYLSVRQYQIDKKEAARYVLKSEEDSLKMRCAFLQDAVNGSLMRRDFLDSFYNAGSVEIDSLRRCLRISHKKDPYVNTVNQTGGQAGFIINNH